ncbi:MAG: hypothetical protein M3Y72_24510 [Acidobacteriota bacterium]|nr:hypothetical protein [Acidobacteriota bacterium]
MASLSDTTDRVIAAGRASFAASLLAFGIQQLIYTGFIKGLELVPEWIPGHTFWAYFTGVALIAAGVSIPINKMSRLAAGLTVVIFIVCILLLHGPRISAIVHDGSERTRAFETLAMCSGALFLFGILPFEPGLRTWNRASKIAIQLGRFFLAISLAIFGLNHFLFARFIATLIPGWIPWHLFWAYFTGAVFVAGAIGTAFQYRVCMAGVLVGAMLFLWVAVLHAPRVAAHLRNGDEWNSAFVALGISGVAFLATGARKGPSEPFEGKRT